MTSDANPRTQSRESVTSSHAVSVLSFPRVGNPFERAREQAAHHTVWVTGCRSWYLDDRGLPAVWPWSFTRFRDEMKAPDPAAYEFA
jgi:hypothetical protein